ncbi:MAG: CDP-alcohol phosphatidyltransferase family protein [Bacteroidota bacterium]
MHKTNYSFLQQALAWSVHVFTASGLVAGFMAILAINRSDWKTAMLWLVAALVIDGIDGTFARLFKVKEILPDTDGKTIDYVVDFANYAIIPSYMFYMAGLAPEPWLLPCVAIILLVSAVYYGIEGMVSEDMYFVGFPVLWNMVLFYLLFVWQLPPLGNVLAIIVFAVLHFIPIKFVYPSQASRFKWPTLINTVLFILTLIAILLYYPSRQWWLTLLAYLTAAYYAVMAVYDTWFAPAASDNRNTE